MKSIIEEASSITKAIEKGWTSAGKPTEFTVKVLEQPVYNFLGFNTKPAKISFFFDDRTITATIEKQTRPESKKPQQRQPQAKQPQARQSDYAKTPRRDNEQRPERQQPVLRQGSEGQSQERTVQPKRQERAPQQQQALLRQGSEGQAKERGPQATWDQSTVAMAQNWVQEFLTTTQKSNIRFTTNVQNHILKIDFNGTITGNSHKELSLFKNAAHLLMSSLRNATNSELKQLKVVFSTVQG